MRFNNIVLMLLFCEMAFAQKGLNLSTSFNLAPGNFTTGSGNFTSKEKIESIPSSLLFTMGLDYSKSIKNVWSFGLGIEYSIVSANSRDYYIEGTTSNSKILVSSNDKAIRQYLYPTASLSYENPLTRKSKLLFTVRGKLGLPFLCYDEIEINTLNPQFGFTNSSVPLKILKYQGTSDGESFAEGMLYGTEFSCLYSLNVKNSKVRQHIQIGPSFSLFKLTSVTELKSLGGLKLVYSFGFGKRRPTHHFTPKF